MRLEYIFYPEPTASDILTPHVLRNVYGVFEHIFPFGNYFYKKSSFAWKEFLYPVMTGAL